jgi:lipid-binding SYLF domain-containing protein
MDRRMLLKCALPVAVAAAAGLPAQPAAAETVSDLETRARRALDGLTSKVPAARALAKEAKAVLVFPRVTRVGLVFGGQHGEGVLFRDGKASDYYYSILGASWGLQAGAQQFGYAMFLMSDAALDSVSSTSGLEIGVGPTVVIVDQGVAQTFSTMSARSDIYAFIFSQRGLMAGLGLQGNRIAKVPRR